MVLEGTPLHRGPSAALEFAAGQGCCAMAPVPSQQAPRDTGILPALWDLSPWQEVPQCVIPPR